MGSPCYEHRNGQTLKKTRPFSADNQYQGIALICQLKNLLLHLTIEIGLLATRFNIIDVPH